MTYALATVRRDGAPVAVLEVGGDYYRLEQLAPDLL